MKTKKTSFLSKFDRLCKEALEDDNLFADEGEDIVDDYESDIDEIEDGEEGETTTYTVELSEEEVGVLRSILDQVGEVDEAEDEFSDEDGSDEDGFDDFGGDDISDIEELEKEAVESQSAPSAESARGRTKSGKASDKTGDLDKETETKDGEEKQYKFVKRTKPTELKHKTTKGS
jgi:hypothetical protein